MFNNRFKNSKLKQLNESMQNNVEQKRIQKKRSEKINQLIWKEYFEKLERLFIVPVQ